MIRVLVWEEDPFLEILRCLLKVLSTSPYKNATTIWSECGLASRNPASLKRRILPHGSWTSIVGTSASHLRKLNCPGDCDSPLEKKRPTFDTKDAYMTFILYQGVDTAWRMASNNSWSCTAHDLKEKTAAILYRNRSLFLRTSIVKWLCKIHQHIATSPAFLMFSPRFSGCLFWGSFRGSFLPMAARGAVRAEEVDGLGRVGDGDGDGSTPLICHNLERIIKDDIWLDYSIIFGWRLAYLLLFFFPFRDPFFDSCFLK